MGWCHTLLLAAALLGKVVFPLDHFRAVGDKPRCGGQVQLAWADDVRGTWPFLNGFAASCVITSCKGAYVGTELFLAT